MKANATPTACLAQGTNRTRGGPASLPLPAGKFLARFVMHTTFFKSSILVVLLVATLAVRASAHHSFAAEYDAKKPVNLKGTVTKVEWVNPHGWIYIDVKQPNGKVANWAVEAGSPQVLARRGLKKTFLAIGAEVVITGYQARDGSNTANGSSVKFPDGRDIFFGSTGADAPAR